MNLCIGIFAILVGSIGLSHGQVDTTQYDQGCSISAGEGGNTNKQCLIPNYWQRYNFSCLEWNFASRDPITSVQKDFDNNDHRWTTVMWFSDSVWAGTLLTYQQILQHAFTYAVLDVHDKWKDSPNITTNDKFDSLAVDEVYVNVTFFLGFCLLDGAECNVVMYLFIFYLL